MNNEREAYLYALGYFTGRYENNPFDKAAAFKYWWINEGTLGLLPDEQLQAYMDIINE